VLDAESVSSGNDRRDGHLRSPDFFDAKKYPEIRFKSTKIEKSDSETLTVHGDLTFHGVTRPVKAEVRYGGSVDDRGGKRAGFDGVLTISRKDFGVTYGDRQLGDDVTIRAGITGVSRG
ncbi:MAG TPA: YceI family protein, partial [Planctomycetota bacterium]|nr:YceI family protein [Planctomycetota bacterium]